MSICHDRGDIFFGMVMVAVSPSLALGHVGAIDFPLADSLVGRMSGQALG